MGMAQQQTRVQLHLVLFCLHLRISNPFPRVTDGQFLITERAVKLFVPVEQLKSKEAWEKAICLLGPWADLTAKGVLVKRQVSGPHLISPPPQLPSLPTTGVP